MKLTPKEYVARGGLECPHCESLNVEAKEVTVEAGAAYQQVGCIDCDGEWVDTYVLTGYTTQE